jgi:GGDEF domain-containing protein
MGTQGMSRTGGRLAWFGLAQLALAALLVAVAGRQRPALAGLGLALLVVQGGLMRWLAASAEAARREARVQALLATRDGLTGLLNRRALDERLAGLDGRPFATLFVDLDHFKAINTAYRDHAVGDAALRAVAAAIQTVVRPGMICARYGGEELCVLLPAAATLRRANAGLFAAKDAGCDRVVIAADAPGDAAHPS